MYAQIIDDTVGNTLVSASTLQKEVKAELEKTNDVACSSIPWKSNRREVLWKRASRPLFLTEAASSIRVRVKALADAAREAGLEF